MNDVPRSLNDVLDVLDQQDGDRVSIENILDTMGQTSFAPLLLAPALILVSPVSGIPGVPTIGSILLLLIISQKLMGRKHIWLPGWIKHRSMSNEQLKKGIAWIRKPAQWIDTHSKKRLSFLVTPPLNVLASIAIMIIALVMPVLELLPFVTSFFSGAIVLFATGMLLRDGLYTLLGYTAVGLTVTVVLQMTLLSS